MGKVKDFDKFEKDDYKDEEYEEEYEKLNEKSKYKYYLISILNLVSNCFIKLGIIIAICLLILFFITGKIKNVLFFIFILMVAFSFGYIFMFLLDHFMVKIKRN